MSTHVPTVDVVIVDYNAGDQLQRCVASISHAKPQLARLSKVVVVDNASDPPTSKVLTNIPLFVRLIRNNVNLGFATACNQGAQGSVADYLLLLNPDTEVTGASLDGPTDFLEQPENRDVAIVGIQLLDWSQTVTASCVEFPKACHYWNKALGLDRLSRRLFPSGSITHWDHRSTRVVDQVMGAFFFVRRTVFETLGGFDERFFVYFEETDFSRRAALAGYKSVFLAGVCAVHTGQGTTKSIKATRLFYSWRSRLAYAGKHFTFGPLVSLALVTLVIEPITRAVATATTLSPGPPSEVGRAYSLLCQYLCRRAIRKVQRALSLAVATLQHRGGA